MCLCNIYILLPFPQLKKKGEEQNYFLWVAIEFFFFFLHLPNAKGFWGHGRVNIVNVGFPKIMSSVKVALFLNL